MFSDRLTHAKARRQIAGRKQLNEWDEFYGQPARRLSESGQLLVFV
jgi:hypothetical protein